MTNSMTAFARGEQLIDTVSIEWELKSLNHRYLEIVLFLPESLRRHEMAIRTLIKQHISRGKLELRCKLQPSTNSQQINVDEDRVRALIDACNQIDMQLGVGQSLNALDILQYPGIAAGETMTAMAVDEKAILTSLQQALLDLKTNRAAEGQRLQQFIEAKAQQVTDIAQTIRLKLPVIKEQQSMRLNEKIKNLGQALEQDRLHQEIALIISKLDIDEELDRLNSHLHELSAVFTRDEAIGRRLDFLMQELQREANTIAAKSVDAEVSLAAVELKVLIEQMREQIQNIE